jgi:hypothetical protein
MPGSVTTTSSVVPLVASLADIKAKEAKLKLLRHKLEADIIAACGFSELEGSVTYEADDGGARVKFVCKQTINRRVDAGIWQSIRKELPTRAHATIREKYEVALPAARKLREEDPGMWGHIAQAVSSTPGKPSVEIKLYAEEGGGAG